MRHDLGQSDSGLQTRWACVCNALLRQTLRARQSVAAFPRGKMTPNCGRLLTVLTLAVGLAHGVSAQSADDVEAYIDVRILEDDDFAAFDRIELSPGPVTLPPAAQQLSGNFGLLGLESGQGRAFLPLTVEGETFIVEDQTGTAGDTHFSVQAGTTLPRFIPLPELPRSAYGALQVPGFCALSEQGETVQGLRAALWSFAIENRRIPVEAWAPCEELLSIPGVQTPISRLIQLERLAFGPATSMNGPEFVDLLRLGLAEVQVLSRETMLGLQTSLAETPFSNRRVRINWPLQGPQNVLVYLDLDRFHDDSEEGLDLKGVQEFMAITGLIAVGEEVWVLTVSAGANRRITLAQVFDAFDRAFQRLSLHFAEQN